LERNAMSQGKPLIIVLVALVFGFAGGFILRPIITPAPQTAAVASQATIAPTSTEARGTQYFVAHVDEARRIVAGCRDGSVRGGECASAEQAVAEVEGRERFKKFMGN
jgi:hypothetical protein